MTGIFDDFTEQEKKQTYDAVIDSFVAGEVDETYLRKRLAQLGFNAVEIDREVELCKEKKNG